MVLCKACRTRFSHFVAYETDEFTPRRPDLTRANGIPRELVFVLCATPLMISASSTRSLGETQRASLHLNDAHTSARIDPITRRSAGVPRSLRIQDSRYHETQRQGSCFFPRYHLRRDRIGPGDRSLKGLFQNGKASILRHPCKSP